MSASPIAVGEPVAITHSCGGRMRPHKADLTVTAVTQMGGITGDWRIRATRCDGTPVEWPVDNAGRETAS